MNALHCDWGQARFCAASEGPRTEPPTCIADRSLFDSVRTVTRDRVHHAALRPAQNAAGGELDVQGEVLALPRSIRLTKIVRFAISTVKTMGLGKFFETNIGRVLKRARDSNLYKFLKPRAGNSEYGVAVALLAFITGVCGSTYSSAIRRSIPFAWPAPDWVFYPSVAIFWFLAISWLILYFVRQDSETESLHTLRTNASGLVENVEKVSQTVGTLEETVKVINEQSDRIREAVLTLPPQSFVTDLCRLVTFVNTMLMAPLPRTPAESGDEQKLRENLEKLIHALLGIVTLLLEAMILDSQGTLQTSWCMCQRIKLFLRIFRSWQKLKCGGFCQTNTDWNFLTEC